MLNELLSLERGLLAYGFATVPRHPDVSQLLKGDVVRVRLAADISIAELELLDGKTRPEIWTLRDGKHNGFPGLKTGRGLVVLDTAAAATHDERWKAAKSSAAKRAEIERVASCAVLDPEAGDWPKPGHRTRIAERLAELCTLDGDANTAAVPAAFERFLAALTLQPPFLHRLYDALLDRARNGDDGWVGMVRAAFVGPVPLAIDTGRELKFERDAGDARQVAAVSRALSGAVSNSNFASNDRVCALTGAATRLLDGNFPQPTLPSLGQTYLFSRNKDICALARYGRNGPSCLPVDADLVERFSGALAAITDREQSGKTWRLLSAEAGDGQDLFIAFIASAMDADAASTLSDTVEDEDDDDGDDREPIIGRAHVEQAASRLVRFWKGIADKAKPGERARILILRTVDPGNRKAIYDRSPPVEALHDAARLWSAAMTNAPGWIGFTVFKDKKAVQGRPRVQAPLSLIPLSRKLYIRGGNEAVVAPAVSGSEALALYLNDGDLVQRARRILRLLLERHTKLLVAITQANLRRTLKDFDPKTTARVDALRTSSWIGGLLFFLGRTKETYMEDAGFKLGQLLSATDAVHVGYCTVVRAGAIPPTLVGNSVFAAAGRNPDRALDVLQTRWKPYHAWATKAAAAHRDKPDDEKAWAVAHAISQARHAKRLCEELQPALARMRQEARAPGEAFRAELLLGYVAGIRPEKKLDESKPEKEGIAA